LVATEGFESSVEGWWDGAGEGASSEVHWDPAGQLIWSVELVSQQAAWLGYEWLALAEANGLTFRLTSLDRPTHLLVGLHEADESIYVLSLPLDQGVVTEQSLDYRWFGLQADSEDENGRLDPDQVTMLSLAEISAFLGGPSPNRLALDEVLLWTGTPAPPDLLCAEPASAGAVQEFRVGVDGNYVPNGDRHGGFWVGDERVDALELFASNGVDAFRLRLWVGNSGESRLNYATDLALRAQQAGLHPYVVLFLSEDWSDVSKQPAPAKWAGLTIEERAIAIRDYARETAQHFLDRGIQPDFYEIGNEIDYGICGVFADVTQPRDPASLRGNVWPDEARLIQAAVEGVREADPEAAILLHIALSWEPSFAVAFFQSMEEFGVQYDYVGLSFYPTAAGAASAARLCETLDRLRAEVDKPVVIAEAAYPAEPMAGGIFEEWRKPLPGYPLTPEGQAWWIQDFYTAMYTREDVIGVYYFSPSFWFSGVLWGPLALFDGEGRARPGVASFDMKR
jgi:arabinogalactan endo-1,4-beta-galactosidase